MAVAALVQQDIEGGAVLGGEVLQDASGRAVSGDGLAHIGGAGALQHGGLAGVLRRIIDAEAGAVGGRLDMGGEQVPIADVHRERDHRAGACENRVIALRILDRDVVVFDQSVDVGEFGHGAAEIDPAVGEHGLAGDVVEIGAQDGQIVAGALVTQLHGPARDVGRQPATQP